MPLGSPANRAGAPSWRIDDLIVPTLSTIPAAVATTAAAIATAAGPIPARSAIPTAGSPRRACAAGCC